MKEIEIPEGYEARIEGNKVILEPKGSEDERIIQMIKKVIYDCNDGTEHLIGDKEVALIMNWLEKHKEQKIKTDACGFPLREHEESACSYLERSLAPDMRHIWYEACAEIKEKQKEQEFTHHEVGESLEEAVTHQMEDDGDVDDFVRKGLDDVVLKYAKLGAEWQKEQKPAEWSEEDEAFLRVAIAICNRYSHKDIADWLKSLRPQPHWKPSEEQMDALKETAEWKKYSNPQLFSLYEDLQKLM